MTIDAVSWNWAAGGTTATFGDFQLFMGHSASGELGTRFDDNYIPGSKVLVLSEGVQTVSAGSDGWITLELETPFEYNGTDNLVIEVHWSSGSGSVYTYKWETGQNRSLTGAHPTSPDGSLDSQTSQIRIDMPLALEQMTFGRIKAELGSIR